VFTSADREKQKGEMLRSIVTVSNIIERDIRMAGCGLPGNGMRAILNDGTNDQLLVFTNENRVRTVLIVAAQLSDYDLYIADTTGFKNDGWICLEGPDTIYREIAAIKNTAGINIIELAMPVGVVGPFTVGTKVHAATRISYTIASNPKPVLKRKLNDMSIDLGAKLQKIAVIPKNGAGSVVASARDADVLTVVLGGYIGKNGNRFLLADSTEVNIRN
jgi:hypothetical protein